MVNTDIIEWEAWTIFTQVGKLAAQNAPKGDNLQVLVVGAGHSGLALRAHLKKLGINSRLVEKSSRIGDSWRNRYENLTLHTPTYTDRYPFQRYPEQFPSWLGRGHVAEWVEHYSEDMELNIGLARK